VPGRTTGSAYFTNEEILKANKSKANELSLVEDVGDGVNTSVTFTWFMMILAHLTNSRLTYMVQFMQIVVFFSMLALINLKSTPFAYRILQTMYTQTHMKYIPMPFRHYNYEPIDDAWIWKHQLTENGAPPFILQDSGPEIFLVIFVYLLNLVFWPRCFKQWHSALVGARLMCFLTFWSGLLEPSLRCLGHFWAISDRQLMSWDNWASVGLSFLFPLVYMYELMFMLQVNSIIGKTLGHNDLSGLALVQKWIQKDRQIGHMDKTSGLMIYKPYFEVNAEDVSKSALENLFCRNYNTILLIKF
jgi:hypothetical protein